MSKQHMRTIAIVLAVVATVTTAAAQSWRTVQPDGAGFAAMFPGPPEVRSRVEQDDHGQWTNRSWRVVASGETYQVTTKDYSQYDISGVPIDQVLAVMCRAAVGTAGEAIASGVPARQCSRDENAARVYWRAPMLYTAIYSCEPGSCRAENRERFLRGFQIR